MRLIDADALIQSLEKKHAHWHELVPEENKEIEYAHQYAVNVIRNAPSAEPTGDLISREDAINAVAVAVLEDKDELEAIKALPSAVCDDCIWHVCNYNKVDWDAPTADAEPSLKAIKRQIDEHWYLDPPSAEAVHKPDYSYEADMARRLKESLSAEAVQGWIPCSERLPKELEAVNVTWVNHNPPCYYMDIMNVPFTGTCVRYKGKWYWWDSTICDVLGEYGEECGADPIDKYIEVTAWQPLPTPYKGGDDE